MNATLKHVRYVATENPVTLGAFILFTGFVLLALFGPWIAPYDALAATVRGAQAPRPRTGSAPIRWARHPVAHHRRRAPRFRHRGHRGAASFGRSALGRCGLFGGWADRIIGRIADTIMAFPLFVLAMGIVAALGNTVANIVIATAIINLPFYIRVARAEVNVRRNAGYVEAARLAGNSDLRVLALHVFPNVLPPMMVQISLNMGWAILNAAGLSCIGMGVRPPQAEWGIMVAEGATYIISGEWWVALFPGAVLMLAVFTFNLLGDGLRDIMDPRMRT
jgi:peptide/nickel transport system permease protein